MYICHVLTPCICDRVGDVVRCFEKIIEWDDLNGGVVAVTPKGIKVMHPRTYKARL